MANRTLAFLLALSAALPSLPGQQVPELVLLRGGLRSIFGVVPGDGGIGTVEAAARGQSDPGRLVTRGGVVVHCRPEGVKVAFPGGRELLFGPDGHLHLRDGAVVGPFGGGVALMIADGAEVRIERGGSRRAPIEQVVVVQDGAARRAWQRRDEELQPVRITSWVGDRLFCLGDGGTLYRALAVGPLVTMRRVLEPRQKRAQDAMPELLLLLMVEPLVQSLHQLQAAQSRAELQHHPLLTELCEHVDAAFGGKGQPQRVGSSPLRYVLPSGVVLQLQVRGAEIAMGLRREATEASFVEWHLAYGASARAIATTAHNQVSRIVHLPPPPNELAVRIERQNLPAALAVVRELSR